MANIPGTNGNDTLNGTAGNDGYNPLANDGYDLIRGSAGNDTIDLRFGDGRSFYELDYSSLANGIVGNFSTLNNVASVAKGALGLDTILGLTRATDTWTPTGDGVVISGTAFNDTFNVNAREGTWIGFVGGEGSDSYGITFSGYSTVRLDFHYGFTMNPTSGLSINLGTRTIANDGFGNAETLTITGVPGRVEVRGTRLADTLTGSAYDDSFRPTAGNDTITGLGGWDRLRYGENSIESLVADMSAGIATFLWDGAPNTQMFSGIEELEGSNSADVLRGDNADNHIRGRRGDDSIVGRNGNDTLRGEDGNDTLEGGEGNDRLEGDDGDDRLLGGPGDDTIEDGSGYDYIDGGAGTDWFQRDYGGSFTFVPVINLATNRIFAQGSPADFEEIHNIENVRARGDHHHVIEGNASDNRLETGIGNDSLNGGLGNDTLIGNEGNDTLRGSEGRDDLRGGAGNDLLDASGGSAASQGFGDFVEPGLGSDTVVGHAGLWAAGEGIDLFYGDISGLPGLAITANGATGTGTVTGAAGQVNDTFSYTHYFIGSQGDDTITGSDADHWEGMQGRGGNDTFNGRGGYTQVSYDGDHFSGATTGITANLATGKVIDAFGFTDTLLNIDELRGTVFADKLDARAAAQGWRLDGHDGNDTLLGGNSRDELLGGDGNDLILGGRNYDRLEGGAGDDILIAQEAGLFFTEVSAVVYRLYDALLGRAPDAAGHQAWMKLLATGDYTLREAVELFMTFAEFTNIYNGTSDQQFIRLLYENVFDRVPRQAEVDAWAANLARPEWTRARLVETFSEETEHKIGTRVEQHAFDTARDPVEWFDDVYRLFRAIFDRDPDSGGLVAWIDTLASGRSSFDTVVTQFMASTEFQNTYGNATNGAFIDLLYRNVLKRDPDPAGRAGWEDNLDNGMSRVDVVKHFMKSAEFVNNTAQDMKDFVIDLYGTDDVLIAGPGNDVLSGGIARDEFRFTADAVASEVTVTDLEPWDVLDFSDFGLTAQQVLNALSQQGDDVVFNAQGETVIFLNTQQAEITGDMLINL